MQNDIDIYRGIKSDIQKNPENFKPAGKWLDDFCQDIVNQAEQCRQKLPQIKSAALRKIQNKKSLLKNIQHEKETLRKRIAPHEHNDKKYKEEKQRLSTLSDKAYQLTLEVHELQRELENIESRSQDKPGFILLMSKASEEAFCEYPRDYRKIMLIAWIVTDEYLHLSKLGITKYEQYAFNYEVIEPEGNRLPQTEQEMAKDAVLARPHAMEIIQDAYLSYKGLLSGESIGTADEKTAKQKNLTDTGQNSDKEGEAETPKQPIALKIFIKTYCDLSENPDIDSKCEMLMRECRQKRIKLPLVNHEYRPGQRKLYYLDKLLKNWPIYRMTLTTLPPLKKSGNK